MSVGYGADARADERLRPFQRLRALGADSREGGKALDLRRPARAARIRSGGLSIALMRTAARA